MPAGTAIVPTRPMALPTRSGSLTIRPRAWNGHGQAAISSLQHPSGIFAGGIARARMSTRQETTLPRHYGPLCTATRLPNGPLVRLSSSRRPALCLQVVSGKGKFFRRRMGTTPRQVPVARVGRSSAHGLGRAISTGRFLARHLIPQISSNLNHQVTTRPFVGMRVRGRRTALRVELNMDVAARFQLSMMRGFWGWILWRRLPSVLHCLPRH